jgi:hypothetical protein
MNQTRVVKKIREGKSEYTRKVERRRLRCPGDTKNYLWELKMKACSQKVHNREKWTSVVKRRPRCKSARKIKRTYSGETIWKISV